MRGMLNPLGDVRPSVSVISTTEALVSVATNLHCAQIKKLMWLLCKIKSVPSLATRDSSNSHDNESHSHCRVCLQSLGGAYSLLPSRRKSCAACLEAVCSKCCSVKKLSFLSQAKFAFCSRCVTRAYEASAVAAAIDEIDDPRATFDGDFFLLRGVLDSTTPPTSFSSSSSR